MLLNLPADLSNSIRLEVADTSSVRQNQHGAFDEPSKSFSTAKWTQLSEAYGKIIRSGGFITTLNFEKYQKISPWFG